MLDSLDHHFFLHSAMKNPLAYLVASVIAFSVQAVSAQSLADAVPVFKAGGWTVLRTVDAMSDKTSCTGILNGDYGIQLSENALYLAIRGGVRSIELRFDDQPAERLRLPTDFERRGTVVIGQNEFVKALGSRRLRAQVMTVLDRIERRDLDLTGINEAHANIKAGCPGDALAAEKAENQTPLCSSLVMQRMRTIGLREEQITSVCQR